MIRVRLPAQLRDLAKVGSEVIIEIQGEVSQRTLLDAIEDCYPMLKGTIRDHITCQRRDYLRFFASKKDLSFESPDLPLPKDVVSGKEPYYIIGAIAGG